MAYNGQGDIVKSKDDGCVLSGFWELWTVIAVKNQWSGKWEAVPVVVGTVLAETQERLILRYWDGGLGQCSIADIDGRGYLMGEVEWFGASATAVAHKKVNAEQLTLF